MESDMEVEYVHPLTSAVKDKASKLLLNFCVLRSQRYTGLHDKYRKERDSIKQLVGLVIHSHEKINELCKRMLNMTYNLDEKSTAVISAILNNMFSEKAAIDDLFVNINRIYAKVYGDFRRCDFLFYRLGLDIANSREEAEAENLLTHLREHVILINEKVSNGLEKFYRFLGAMERTKKKIEKVVKK